MKTLVLGLVVSTVVFAGSSAYLWHELGQARDRAADIEQASARLNARIADLEKARAEFAARRFGGGFNGNLIGSHTMPAAVDAPSSAIEAKPADHLEANAMNGPRPDRLPGFQKMMRGQIKGNLRRLYADVGEALGLDKTTADKLVDLLTEQQLRGMTASREAFENADGKTPEEMSKLMEDMRHQQETEITDLVGADKAEALKKYQESMPARSEVDMIARQLEGTDAPLTDAQRKQMVNVITEERSRVPMPEYYDGIDLQQYQKDVAAWQTDYNDRVASQARNILSSDQLATYTDYQQWQTEMREQFAASNPNAIPRRFRGVNGGPNVMFTTAVPLGAPPPRAAPSTRKN